MWAVSFITLILIIFKYIYKGMATSVFIPIPKKGNAKECSSYCTIALISHASNGEGNGTPLWYSCLENPMDGGAWKAAVNGVAEGQTWLSDFTLTFQFHALEKEMATHSNVLAWGIPGTGSLMGCCLWVAQSRTRLKRLSSSSSTR